MKRFFLQIFYTLLAIAIGFIPVWVFLGAKSLLNPTGFWQNIVTYGAAIYFLGFVQFVLFLFFLYFMWVIWKVKWT